MVSHLKTVTHKGCKIAAQKKFVFERILQGSGGYTTRIRRLYNKDQEVISRIFFGTGATIRIGREMFCLPYAWLLGLKSQIMTLSKFFWKSYFLGHCSFTQLCCHVENFRWNLKYLWRSYNYFGVYKLENIHLNSSLVKGMVLVFCTLFWDIIRQFFLLVRENLQQLSYHNFAN